MSNSEAKKLLKCIVGTNHKETIDDIVRFMLEYAKSMRKRYKEAVDVDKWLSCSTVALRMEDTASRIKYAIRRERAQWRKKMAQSSKVSD